MRLALLSIVFGTTLSVGGAPALAAPREIVFADEAFAAKGDQLPGLMEALGRRMDALMGWRAGTARVRGFSDADAALAHMRRKKPTFAILPLRAYVQGRAALGFDVLAQAIPVELYDVEDPMFYGVTLSSTNIGAHIQMYPGFRLAVAGGEDKQWVRALFDGTVNPYTHFKHVPVATDAEALAAVVGKRADLAMLHERSYKALRPRTADGGDLKVVYVAPGAAPHALVAVGKAAKSDDRRKLEQLSGQICADEGRKICSELGLLWFVRKERVPADKQQAYANWAWKYEHYR